MYEWNDDYGHLVLMLLPSWKVLSTWMQFHRNMMLGIMLVVVIDHIGKPIAYVGPSLACSLEELLSLLFGCRFGLLHS